jgi:hypothetical protein
MRFWDQQQFSSCATGCAQLAVGGWRYLCALAAWRYALGIWKRQRLYTQRPRGAVEPGTMLRGAEQGSVGPRSLCGKRELVSGAIELTSGPPQGDKSIAIDIPVYRLRSCGAVELWSCVIGG